ncbi:MAG: FHA domain-containing protein [Prevotella sp.]|nr:FHA domain-containing protein [Prevotella sp.]
MKVYSIGREVGCDIVINDNTDVISRRHAILNVLPSGKMTIVDQSHNGTYVNGIKISPNVPVPVTRKDNVSFAHVARLDWNLVPKPKGITQYVLFGLIAMALLIGGIVGYNYLPSQETSTLSDTAQVQKSDTIPAEKKEDITPAKPTVKKKVQEKKKTKAAQQPRTGTGKTKPSDKDKKKEGKKTEPEVSAGARH